MFHKTSLLSNEALGLIGGRESSEELHKVATLIWSHHLRVTSGNGGSGCDPTTAAASGTKPKHQQNLLSCYFNPPPTINPFLLTPSSFQKKRALTSLVILCCTAFSQISFLFSPLSYSF